MERVIDHTGYCFLTDIPPLDSEGVRARQLFLPTRNEISSVNLTEYLQQVFSPHRYSKAWGWTAFVHLDTHHDPTVLPFLNARPYFQHNPHSHTYHLDSLGRRIYSNVGEDLHLAVHTLNLVLGISNLKPVLPIVFGIEKIHPSIERSLEVASVTQHWCRLWLGLLSATIATYLYSQDRLGIPEQLNFSWREHLKSSGFSEDWLNSIESSSVCDFHKRGHRLGTFLDVDELGEWLFMDTVKYLQRFHVPFWILLGSTRLTDPLCAKLRLTSVGLSNLRRISVCYQNVSRRYLVNASIKPDDFTSDHCPKGQTQDLKEPSPYRQPPWVSFFNHRNTLGQQLEKIESPSDQLKRVRREQNPSYQNSIVYEWQLSSDGVWERRRISARYRLPFLKTFSPAQRRYDSHFNEWDCCRVWGPDPPLGTILDFTMVQDNPEMALPLAPSLLAVGPSYDDIRHMYAVLPQFVFPHSQATLSDDLVSLFKLFYGPQLTQTTPTVTCNISRPTLVLILKFFGFPHETVSLVSLLNVYIKNAFMHLKPIFESEVSITLPDSLLGSSYAEFPGFFRLRFLVKVNLPTTNQTLLMFDFGEGRTAPWNLAVYRSMDVLMLCRLDPVVDDQGLALKLLEWAIPFQTLHPVTSADDLPPSVAATAQFIRRPSNYVFKEQDFQAYILGLEDFLSYRRGRAALMRGGFCWRLALPYQSFESVLSGTLSIWESQEEVLIAKSADGHLFVDDALLLYEIDNVLGLILPPQTSNDNAKRSYFPLEDHVQKSGFNYGRWTPILERIFQGILNPADATYPLPIISRGWRNQFRGSGSVRRVLLAEETIAKHIVENLLNSL